MSDPEKQRAAAIASEHAAHPLSYVDQDDPVVIDALKVKISLLEVLLKNTNARVESQDVMLKQLRERVRAQDDDVEDMARCRKFEDLCDKINEFMGW